jgi:hypothetical protein
MGLTTDKIDFYLVRGSRDKDWYARCTLLFIELFGEERLPLICKLFAATSINTSLKSNITLFRKALYEIENNLPIGKYLPNIQIQLNRIRNNEELSGRKIRSFAAAMNGDRNAVVVDIWLLRAFGIDRKYYRQGSAKFRNGGPTDKEYDLIELYCREKASLLGIEPREVSAMLWSGCRLHHTNDRETNYHNLLRYKMFNLFNVI